MNSLQILSAPRMGSTVVHKYAHRALGYMLPREYAEPSEFLNQQIYRPEEMLGQIEYKLEKMDEYADLDICIKVHINHLYDLEKYPELKQLYSNKTESFDVLVLVRRNVTDKIISQCIAELTKQWDGIPDPQQSFTITRPSLMKMIGNSFRQYNWLVNYSRPHVKIYYEDFLSEAWRTEHFPRFGRDFHPEQVEVNIQQPSDKSHYVENLSYCQEQIQRAAAWSADFDYVINEGNVYLSE